MQASCFFAPAIVLMAGLLTSPASPALAAGALAIEPGAERPAFGSSVNRPTPDQAQKEAIDECRRNGGMRCKIDREFSSACFAVARGVSGRIYPATGRSLTEAEDDASRQCRRFEIRGYNARQFPVGICRIGRSDCDTTSGIGETKGHLWADRLRQTKIPINFWTGLTAIGAHLTLPH